MAFTFTLMNEKEAQEVLSWHYEDPYAVYNMGDDASITELLDRRSPYYAVRDEHGELVGHFSFGSSCLVWGSGEPGIYEWDGAVAIGLALRPDLTGKGLGLAFVKAGLDFACHTFKPSYFHLFVMAWNERAIRVYERAGFQRVSSYMQRDSIGEREFLEMRLDAIITN